MYGNNSMAGHKATASTPTRMREWRGPTRRRVRTRLAPKGGAKHDEHRDCHRKEP